MCVSSPVNKNSIQGLHASYLQYAPSVLNINQRLFWALRANYLRNWIENEILSKTFYYNTLFKAYYIQGNTYLAIRLIIDKFF